LETPPLFETVDKAEKFLSKKTFPLSIMAQVIDLGECIGDGGEFQNNIWRYCHLQVQDIVVFWKTRVLNFIFFPTHRLFVLPQKGI